MLKIDIEGEEWPVFENLAAADLDVFAQIVCEFHSFDKGWHSKWRDRALGAMRNLRDRFEVIHVHGNNNEPHALIANVPFRRVLEVTFKARYRFTHSTEVYPSEIDQPNLTNAPDLFLGNFKFSNLTLG